MDLNVKLTINEIKIKTFLAKIKLAFC
jgi:hypothetical protein